MTMPETTMRKYDRFVLWQNNVRFTREVFTMKPEAVSQRMEQGSDENLRFSVFPSYRSHIAASLFRCVNINHHASPAFTCLFRTKDMNPARSRSHALCVLLYVFCRLLGTMSCNRFACISFVWFTLMEVSSVNRCFRLIRSASANTWRQRSLHVLLTPSIVK